MDEEDNFRKYGLRLSDLDIATRVACHLSKGEHNELTRRWTEEHRKLDEAREAEEKKRAARSAADVEVAAAAAAIYKKHGVQG